MPRAGLLVSLLLLPLLGCPLGTPKEEIARRNGRITSRGNGVIDLTLTGSRITDYDMHFVNGVLSNNRAYREIFRLDVSGSMIGDEGLRQVAPTPGLTELDISGSRVTDLGIARLKEAAGLKVLSLKDTTITDAAVQFLETFKTLEQLDVSDTRLTPAAIQRLRQALPGCRVID